jgi:hypothetical protein
MCKRQRWVSIVTAAGRRARGETGWRWPCVASERYELRYWNHVECVSAWEADHQNY